jgi:glycerol-3-phosphate cytidylyltransferase-like family protein
MKEVWKDIPKYEGLYQVSNLGRIKRLFKNGKENILTGTRDKDGYTKIILSKNQHKKHVRAHRLVAEAFLSNPENKPEVNHKDRNKQNNVVNVDDLQGATTNLEWATCSENSNHCVRTGRRFHKRAVAQYTKDMKLLSKWNSIKEAGQTLKISSNNICSCCNGKLPTAGGYIWRYEGVNI